LPTKHIIIADDEELLCVTIAGFLRDEGYQVTVVHDGEDVLPVIQKETVHLALLDLMMPRMNGLETLAEIKKQSPSTKVIMLTGYGNEDNIQMSKRLGADGFVNKPFGVETLLRHIKNLLLNPSSPSFQEPPIG
jgi:DNA-binding response OmpR family regulator